MKKKFLILISIFGLFLILGATVVIFNIDLAISNLDRLIERYQKDRKCTKILMAIKEVQQDGFLHHTYDDSDKAGMDKRITKMDEIVTSCSSCHHPAEVTEQLKTLTRKTTDFKLALTLILEDTNNPRHTHIDLQTYAMGHALYDYAQSLFKKTAKQLAADTQAARAITVKSKHLIYFIVLSGLVFMIITSLLLMRCFTKPLQYLLTATEKIQRGNLDFRVLGLKHEFGTLAASFNDMAASLQTQMEQLQRSEQLAACGKIATTLVHEVRNPLAGIKVAMAVLSGESSVSEEDRKILGKVVNEVNRIDNLLSNMLKFARPKPPQYSTVKINDVIEKALKFTPGVIKNKIQVDWDKSKQPPDITADPDQLYQVFLNLFINAEATLPKGGTIFISTSWNDQNIQIDVADNGPGIAIGHFEEIFTPFFTTKAKCSGLGLATCRSLVNLLHGNITCANRHEGGACFTITLPLKGGQL
jgi:signal transduction histidine kinase